MAPIIAQPGGEVVSHSCAWNLVTTSEGMRVLLMPAQLLTWVSRMFFGLTTSLPSGGLCYFLALCELHTYQGEHTYQGTRHAGDGDRVRIRSGLTGFLHPRTRLANIACV